MRRITLHVLLLLMPLATAGGCAVAGLIGGMAQNYEYNKLIEVPAQYDGLEGALTAVVVQGDMGLFYQYPGVPPLIARDVSQRLARDVPGSRVLNPEVIARWQYNTPHWDSLPHGEVAEALGEKFGVERLVVIDIYEYRLHPPGNSWEWAGACGATVGVIERTPGRFVSDEFVISFDIKSTFPEIRGVGRDNASREQIEYGLLADFIKRCAWVFHEHLEPKYPDKYRPTE